MLFKAKKAIWRPAEWPFGVCSEFFMKILRDLSKCCQFLKKKSSKKFVPRPAAFILTLIFIVNSLWSCPSDLHQIWIMWLTLPKLSFHEKFLAFKGQQGQQRPSIFLLLKFGQQKFIAKWIFFKNMHFLFIQTLSLVEFEGVCFTSAWPFWPLKVNFFSSNNFFLQKNGVI